MGESCPFRPGAVPGFGSGYDREPDMPGRRVPLLARSPDRSCPGIARFASIPGWPLDSGNALSSCWASRTCWSRPKPGAAALGLTGRQLEILRLLSAGLTNAEIAARLVLSVRTVDHHVSAVLQKLGVSSRAEAAVVASGLGR